MKATYPRGTASYRKKPRAVFAVKFNPRQRNWPPTVYETGYQFYCKTAHGDVQFKVGDYICWQKVAGRLDVWPVAADIFQETYERVPAPTSTTKGPK